ncbi:MAG: glycoside hydrolase family 3 C-terminal domain-containing protein [Flexilinea sp.]|nr:glycoside hydrolase family 3 C-terminal domain-containing protein [Flexilinea sp.]
MNHWTRARYQVNLPLYEGQPKVTASEAHLAIARQAAREGMILLKNEGGLLPLSGGTKTALFGKGTFDYVKGGGGSGDVTCAFVTNLYEGLKQQEHPLEIFEPLCDYYRENVREQMENGAQPGLTVEPPVPQDLLEKARAFTDTAIISISRFSGEGWDRYSIPYPRQEPHEKEFADLSQRLFPDSDFYLTPGEKAMAEAVCANFSRVIVVLNIGGMMDAKWYAQDERIGSVLLAWQGGMTGGLAAADLLMGVVSPCGRLPDTIAGDLADYPSTAGFHESPDYVNYTEDIYVGYRYFETLPGMRDKVVYPFGYGLSYTRFELETISAEAADGEIRIRIRVSNSGEYPGKEVVQVYYEAPSGKLGKPARALAAFVKTGTLQPGERQEITLSFPIDSMASYDDLGKISRSAYVLEQGEYRFYVGKNVRDAEKIPFIYTVEADRITMQLSSKAAPVQLKERLRSDGTFEPLPAGTPHDPMENGLGWEGYPSGDLLAPQTRFVDYQPFFGYACQISFDDVADGKATLDAFMAQLSLDEKIHLLCGQPNTGAANTFGFGNLPEYGVPSVMTADGPAGLRIRPVCGVNTTAFPCATLMASTWDPEMVETVGFAAGEEVKENNIHIWLTPAINIHRSPLCGRNFEYYSEDPYLTGMLSGAMIRGIQRNGCAAAIKHFCCNNKETNRRNSDSRVSERALREIYLKGFEIAIREGHPKSLMSSYNLVNGQRASENRDLLEGILRDEWGFDGVVMTDWWNFAEQYKEINAGNDIKMGCGFPERVKKACEMGLVSEELITLSAKRVLELILRLDF